MHYRFDLEDLAHEKTERLRHEAARARLLRSLPRQRHGLWKGIRASNHIMGEHLVQWGLRLQGYRGALSVQVVAAGQRLETASASGMNDELPRRNYG